MDAQADAAGLARGVPVPTAWAEDLIRAAAEMVSDSLLRCNTLGGSPTRRGAARVFAQRAPNGHQRALQKMPLWAN